MLTKIKTVARLADQQGVAAFIVGGIVRDVLLKKKSFDIDIVFEGDALRIARLSAQAFDAKLVVHKQFGTAVCHLPDASMIDFATARKEFYVVPGALPRVVFSTLKNDLMRRDFTINSMAICINKQGFGELVDYCHGLDDLLLKKIRVLHDNSFIDDATRILRAVRFEQRLGFKIEKNTLALLKAALKAGASNHIKKPRYFAEYQKFFIESSPVLCLKRLNHLGGLWLCHKPLDGLFNRVRAVERGLNQFHLIDDVVNFYLMAFFEKETPAIVVGAAKDLALKKGQKKSLIQLKAALKLRYVLSKKQITPSQVYQMLKPFNTDVIYYMLFRCKAAIVGQHIQHYLFTTSLVKLKISGQDCRNLGLCSGIKIGRILKQILMQKIDQGFKTKWEELKLLRSLVLEKSKKQT